MAELSEAQRTTLKSAAHHADRQLLYCGDVDIEPDLAALVDGDFMKVVAAPPWLSKGDAYYEITPAGKAALEAGDADR